MAFGTVQSINRAVLIARGKEPFLKWIQGLPDPTEITLDELNRECTVYLIPEYDYEDAIPKIVKSAFQTIFEIELEAWWLDTADWPDTTDYALFKRWFEVEVHSVTRDLAPGPVVLKNL